MQNEVIKLCFIDLYWLGRAFTHNKFSKTLIKIRHPDHEEFYISHSTARDDDYFHNKFSVMVRKGNTIHCKFHTHRKERAKEEVDRLILDKINKINKIKVLNNNK